LYDHSKEKKKTLIDSWFWSYLNYGLNIFLVLIFVVFVADGPHFDRIFKMVLILTECLKWSSFS